MPKPNPEVFTSLYRMQVLNALKKASSAVIDPYLPDPINSAIEIGCGTGFFYQQLAPARLKPVLIGYDSHSPSLDIFKQNSPEAKMVLGDIYNLECKTDSVDVVIGFSSYPLLYTDDRSIEEIRRILRPGGRLLAFHDSLISGYSEDKTTYDAMKRVENFHTIIRRKLSRQNFKVISGDDPVEAVVISPYKVVEQRIPEITLQEKPSQNIIVAVSNDTGMNRIHHSLPEKAANKLNQMIQDMGASKVLGEFDLDFSNQILEYVRMRYIVAEKPV